MRIALLDFLKRDYTVETPRRAPLGGSASAVCYLAEQFAKLGHETYVVNFTSSPGKYLGVEQLSWSQLKIENLDSLNLDAAIIIQAAGRGKAVKAVIGKKGRLVLWGQDGTDQPTVWPLHEPAERDSYDAMVMVSHWQRDQYARDFGIDPQRMPVIGNAISPLFENLFANTDSILPQKSLQPWLAYVSTPYRGLEVLLDVFPEILAHIPSARLGIFSSMKVYGQAEDKYRQLYDRSRQMMGVEYFGSVGQADLAKWLRSAAVLAYPNVYPETACIAVMEAMAAGCEIVTSDLGALPETCAGFGRPVPADFTDRKNRRLFVDQTVAALEEIQKNPAAADSKLRRQLEFVNQKYTWPTRAKDWLTLIETLEGREPAFSSKTLTNLHERIQLATTKYQAGEPSQAQTICREILLSYPDHVEANNLLGVMAFQAGRNEEAIDFLAKAVKMNPHRPDLQTNWGLALGNLGRTQEAQEAFALAIKINPDFIQAHLNLAAIFYAQQNYDEAIKSYQRALEIRPDNAAALYNLGLALRAVAKWDEAVTVLKRAIEIQPGVADIHNNLASALKHIGEFDQAEHEYRKAIELHPGFPQAHSNLIMLMHYQPGKTPQNILHEMRAWNNQHARPLASLRKPLSINRDPHRKLRIGYVSPDFTGHIVGLNLLPLFLNHDRDQFEIYCYSNVASEDQFTNKFQSVSHWRNIRPMTDESAAELIRQDQIDILVDLAGHTADNRLLVFAQKPAPVQITFGGYPGGTGLENMDWHLTDTQLDPPVKTETQYIEKLYRLRDSFWCYDPKIMWPAEELEIAPLPAAGNGYVTFGCLNNFMKVTVPTLHAWAAVLTAVENSRLLMLAPEGSPRNRILDLFAQVNMTDRIEFVDHQYRREYLQTFNRIDIGLDTLPYNGHTTSLDAMWMGVPVVTVIGDTAVGRAGLSHLSKLSLQHLAANHPEDLPEIAKKLAQDLPALAQLRSSMRQRLAQSGLTDGKRFARNIEQAYRDIWQEFLRESA
jgi:protein O-GlcNAc transferase